MSNSQPLLDPDKLQAERIRARLTRPGLARKAGLDPSHIYFLEMRKRGTTPETLGRIADALGIDMEALMPEPVAA